MPENEPDLARAYVFLFELAGCALKETAASRTLKVGELLDQNLRRGCALALLRCSLAAQPSSLPRDASAKAIPATTRTRNAATPTINHVSEVRFCRLGRNPSLARASASA